ncbi:hypothetical protein ACF07T_36645 [Streptomyces sp. NPDC015184]|uniref:hypothetical protein n=1 Tax=Streptomyces sp. NPDC015184 TaxID=3364946 RepID=UPI0036F9B6B0
MRRGSGPLSVARAESGIHQAGKGSADNRTTRVADLTRHHWQGRWHSEDGYRSYDRRIPIVATTLDLLREHGPAGPAFWRFGRDRHQSLLAAVGNPRRDAHLARRRRTAREKERRREERHRAEREARRPTCVDCGQKFTDDRWKAVEYTRDRSRRWPHSHLCEECRSRGEDRLVLGRLPKAR